MSGSRRTEIIYPNFSINFDHLEKVERIDRSIISIIIENCICRINFIYLKNNRIFYIIVHIYNSSVYISSNFY